MKTRGRVSEIVLANFLQSARARYDHGPRGPCPETFSGLPKSYGSTRSLGSVA